MDVSASEMQAFDPEPVVLGRFVLFDVAARFERCEQTKDVVLVQLEPFGKFGYAKLVDLAEKLLEHVERMRDRLDDVVGFIAADHSCSILVSGVRYRKLTEALWKSVLI
jgi:hypothetical protein